MGAFVPRRIVRSADFTLELAPEAALAFFTPGSRIGTVDVRCEGIAAKRTRVTVTYTLTALSEDGVRYLEELDDAAYRAYIDSWREALEKALAPR